VCMCVYECLCACVYVCMRPPLRRPDSRRPVTGIESVCECAPVLSGAIGYVCVRERQRATACVVADQSWGSPPAHSARVDEAVACVHPRHAKDVRLPRRCARPTRSLTHPHTHTHTDREREMQTDTHAHAQREIQTHTCTCIHTRAHTSARVRVPRCDGCCPSPHAPLPPPSVCLCIHTRWLYGMARH
jgi:hypothetical protein